jgi:hypothetical protein
MEKFFIVVRDDLDPGLAMAQACHAAYCFGVYSPKKTRRNIAVLSASKQKLEELVVMCEGRRYDYEPFFEPDLRDEITAAAFGAEAKKLLSSLPLALRLALTSERCSLP